MSEILGNLTDEELRASPVPVSVANQVLGLGDIGATVWGQQKVAQDQSLFHGLWTYDISPKMWFMFHGATQVYTSTSITSDGGQALLTTDAGTPTVRLESRETPRYQPDRGISYADALIVVGKTGGTVEHGLGMFTAAGAIENGIFFRHKPDGKVYACLYSGGVQVREEEIDTSVLSAFDPEKGNIYNITSQWRSVGDQFFYIGNPATATLKLVHVFDNLGQLTEASVENPAMAVFCRVVRDTADIDARWGCADISTEGGQRVNREEYSSLYTKNYSGSTADFPALVMYQPLTINGLPNTRVITLARISLAATSRTYFEIWTTRDPTAITGATFKPLGNGSFVECDSTDMDPTAVRATSVDFTKLSFVTFVRVQANVYTSIDNPDRGRIEFSLVRGDYLVITCNKNAADADVVIEIGEQI